VDYTDFQGASCAEDVSRELLAFLDRPRVFAPENRDDESDDGSKVLKEFGFFGFHVLPINVSTRDVCSSLDCLTHCSDLMI